MTKKPFKSHFYADWNNEQMKKRQEAQQKAYRKAGIPYHKAKRGKKWVPE